MMNCEAVRRFRKENPQFKNADENDLDYLTAKSRYTMTLLKIRTSASGMRSWPARGHGASAEPGAGRQAAAEADLLGDDAAHELGRQRPSASQDWADKIDDGFREAGRGRNQP